MRACSATSTERAVKSFSISFSLNLSQNWPSRDLGETYVALLLSIDLSSLYAGTVGPSMIRNKSKSFGKLVSPG